MDTPFSVTPAKLNDLSAAEAVELFHQLLWAEAVSVGIATSLVNVPSNITVGDGGIDAEVNDAPKTSGQGIIKQGRTAYQIKTGPFSLSKVGHIRDILYRPMKTELQPRVKSCLDQGGTLVVVLFGWDGPDKTDQQLVNAFRLKLVAIDKKYANSPIEVWRPNQLAKFLEPYPSLRMKALRVFGEDFQIHEEWSQWWEMKPPMHADANQNDVMSALRHGLREDSGGVHIRILGEPGVGKTRLVLEATSTSDLAPLVVYFQSPKALRESGLFNRLLLQDDRTRAIYVVDECDGGDRADIWNRLAAVSDRVRLITIYSDVEVTSGTTEYLFPAPLADDKIAEIIAGYGFLNDQVRRWVHFCSGSPRVAHVIGQNLVQNPDDLLRSPDTVDVWNRYVAGTDDLKSELVRARKTVLTWLSLFKHFGFGAPYQKELEQIIQRVSRDGGISRGTFLEIIAALKKRRILQGETTLYITPRLLHIWLWTEWWDTNGQPGAFDLVRFLTVEEGDDGPVFFERELIDGFFEMFRYAEGSATASKVVTRLLSPEGPFNVEFLDTELGSRFFRMLAEANPTAGLVCLKRAIGYAEVDELRAFLTGRREVIHALEMIVLWRPLFPDAARLLLALGEAENERWGNNASGVFAGLFSLGYGPVATTEAPPLERFPVLQEAMASTSKERRALAIRACKGALEMHGLHRVIGSEYQGLRRPPDLWKPATYGDVWQEVRRVWGLLADSLVNLPMDERQEAVEVLLDGAFTQTQNPHLADMVIDTIERVAVARFRLTITSAGAQTNTAKSEPATRFLRDSSG